jgi:hypothetical protein
MSDVDAQEEMFKGATVAELADSDVLASLSAYARAFGTDRETLRRRLLEAGVEQYAERGGHKLYKLREVYLAWSLASGAAVNPENLSPFNRRAWYQAELDRLRLEQTRGEVIPRLEVEQEIAGVLKIAAETFDTLPDIVERDCGATPQQVARIEQVCDRAREEMHKRLTDTVSDTEAKGASVAAPAAAAAPSRPPPSAGAVDLATTYLREALGAGPRPAAELIAEAAVRGLSETSLRRAKSKAGIVARRAGKGWAWSLPDPQDVQGGQAS